MPTLTATAKSSVSSTIAAMQRMASREAAAFRSMVAAFSRAALPSWRPVHVSGSLSGYRSKPSRYPLLHDLVGVDR